MMNLLSTKNRKQRRKALAGNTGNHNYRQRVNINISDNEIIVN